MNKTETLINDVRKSINDNEPLEHVSSKVWNFTSIACVADLIHQLQESEAFHRKLCKSVMEQRDNFEEQCEELEELRDMYQTENKELKEEKENLEAGLETLQKTNTKLMEEVRKANDREIGLIGDCFDAQEENKQLKEECVTHKCKGCKKNLVFHNHTVTCKWCESLSCASCANYFNRNKSQD